jgi:hypothetical protein
MPNLRQGVGRFRVGIRLFRTIHSVAARLTKWGVYCGC